VGLPRLPGVRRAERHLADVSADVLPGKIVAEVMGHAKVDTTLNVYMQVLGGSERAAVGGIGAGLFSLMSPLTGA
jgi:hypothetical protein